MCKANAVGDITEPGYSQGNSAGMDTETMDDVDGLEGAESKVDITTPDKINQISILVSYQLNIRLFIKTYNVEKCKRLNLVAYTKAYKTGLGCIA